MTHLQKIGATIYVKVAAPHQSKLASRSLCCVFLGYDIETKGYHCYYPYERKIIITKDSRCDEDSLFYASSNEPSISPPDVLVWPDEIPSLNLNSKIDPRIEPPLSLVASTPTSQADESLSSIDLELPSSSKVAPLVYIHCDAPPSTNVSQMAPFPVDPVSSQDLILDSNSTRPIRERRPSTCLQDFIVSSIEPAFQESTSFNVAYDDLAWHEAMMEELNQIQCMRTWDLTPLPPGKQTITTKWIFKVKTNADGQPIQHKARLVACGFHVQREGEDCDETYAPVAKRNTLCTFILVAAHYGWSIFHLDVKLAFLQGDIYEEVYVQ